MIAIMLMAQGAPAPAPADVAGIDFDLAKVKPAAPCNGLGSDIVVCARRREENRVGALPEVEISALPKAEFKLFGDVKGAVETEQAGVGGFVSNRVMARVKIPLKR